MQTVVAGQQAENLLDFDAEDSAPTHDDRDSRPLQDGLISNSAIASAAKSTNPLDELMDLFSSASMSAPAMPPGAPSGPARLESLASPPSLLPQAPPVDRAVSAGNGGTAVQGAAPKAEDDLLGLF